MKKLIVVLVLLLAAAAISAQSINLGTFPVGQWLDHNYNVVWDFSSNNIRVLNTEGEVLYDFSSKISDFKITMSGVQPALSFTGTESGRSYLIIAAVPSSDLTLEMSKSDQPKYSVKMKKQ